MLPLRTTIRMSEGGRIVIPAEVRHRLGIESGQELILTVQDDHATLINARAARRKARESVRRFIKPAASLSRELLAERRKEQRDEQRH